MYNAEILATFAKAHQLKVEKEWDDKAEAFMNEHWFPTMVEKAKAGWSCCEFTTDTLRQASIALNDMSCLPNAIQRVLTKNGFTYTCYKDHWVIRWGDK